MSLANFRRPSGLPTQKKSLDDPSARIAQGWAVVDVRLRDGRTLRGFARHRGQHDLQLQTLDGHWRLLLDTEYTEISPEKSSLMPALEATAAERRDLLAYLGGLHGVAPGPLAGEVEAITAEAMQRVIHPQLGEWPTYYGSMSGNRHSSLDQISDAYHRLRAGRTLG